MGTDAHVSVFGDSGLLVQARSRIDDLERRWSRFLPDSELSRLNRAAGHPVAVDEETFSLIALAVHAWRETGGRFDPTVLDAVCAEGYDRSFEQLRPAATAGAVGV